MHPAKRPAFAHPSCLWRCSDGSLHCFLDRRALARCSLLCRIGRILPLFSHGGDSRIRSCMEVGWRWAAQLTVLKSTDAGPQSLQHWSRTRRFLYQYAFPDFQYLTNESTISECILAMHKHRSVARSMEIAPPQQTHWLLEQCCCARRVRSSKTGWLADRDQGIFSIMTLSSKGRLPKRWIEASARISHPKSIAKPMRWFWHPHSCLSWWRACCRGQKVLRAFPISKK